MKSMLMAALLFLVTTYSSAQWELYGARVDGDTVKIWNTNIYVSCLTKFAVGTTVTKDSIIITERDTSSLHATCSCFFDVYVALTGLPSTSYRVVIYREQLKKYKYPKDTTILAASFSFSVSGASGLSQSVKAGATDCHQIPMTAEAARGVPSAMALLTSYPNPFNPTTTISFSLPQTGHAKLEVFDAMGKCIATLVDGKKAAGENLVQFDGSGLASGVYLCRLQAGAFVLTNKLLLLK